jgi:hypothetical protein
MQLPAMFLGSSYVFTLIKFRCLSSFVVTYFVNVSLDFASAEQKCVNCCRLFYWFPKLCLHSKVRQRMSPRKVQFFGMHNNKKGN